MTEIRRKLTDIQFQSIIKAQAEVDMARARVDELQARLEEITGLVFDAHGIPAGAQAVLSQQTREIVIPIENIGSAKPEPPPLRDVKEGQIPELPEK